MFAPPSEVFSGVSASSNCLMGPWDALWLLPCSVSQMLFCTSLLAFVGAGEQPSLSPRKLTLFNTHSNSVIQNLSFPSTVLEVLLNRKRWDTQALLPTGRAQQAPPCRA